MRYSTLHPANRRSRRSGTILVYMALGLTAFIGAASLAVDMGSLYSRRASAQQAADAAALAGAYALATFQADSGNPAPAHAAARDYARLNGYNADVSGVTVTSEYPIAGEFNRFRVSVRRIEPVFFARIFGLPTRPVGASATAEYQTFAELSTTGGGVYGQPDGPTSLSMFGPDGYYSNGDYRSVRLLANGTPNPEYTNPAVDAVKAGYNFTINVPLGFQTTDIEVFDPDTHNADNNPDAGRDSSGKLRRVDEWRRPDGGSGTAADATTTRFSLYWDRGDSNPYNDQLINRVEVGNDPNTDLQWVKMFSFNRANYPSGQFRLNVVTIAGSSENGFNLRAGPPRAAAPPGTDNFDPANGTSVTATGFVPMNFNGGGNTTITLGNVPREAAGKPLTIKKFDTDIDSQRVDYSYVTASGAVVGGFQGVLAGNGEFVTDNIQLPSDYPGGDWRATYVAGNQDTSVWEMSYSAATPGRPGPIRLVR